MSFIILKNIVVEKKKIEYIFEYDELLAKYFTGESFIIEYPEDITIVPKGVLAVPFVTNVLPIIWITNATLSLEELDRCFYESIPRFKQGYINMFPEVKWQGNIQVNNLVECDSREFEGAFAFFSGGLDATTTLLRHYDEKPELLVLWGADVSLENTNAWNNVYKGLKESSENYHLPLLCIRSTFRMFDREGALDADYSKLLKDNWWHGVKHGIGLIGHAAPMAWIRKKKILYIASSFSEKDKGIRCASYPTIDNNISFCGVQVLHDGFEYNRQEKIRYIVDYHRKYKDKIILRVCWQSKTGDNCCTCEKCYRTMVGLWIEGENPREYGFVFDENNIFNSIYELIALKYKYDEVSIAFWNDIKKTMIENWNILEKKDYAENLSWILNFDFNNIEKNKCREMYEKQRLKELPWKLRISKKFPNAYSIYTSIKLKLIRKGKK